MGPPHGESAPSFWALSISSSLCSRCRGITNGGWVNFFEEFTLVSGALIVLGATISNSHQGPRGLARIGYVFFGVCVISFTAAQVVYFSITKNLVPKWIPPGQSF